ncbi:MAG TPA: hypothetical protein VNU19_05905, partial [Candidatus Acidoferrum sp.]|nr:hypothetical protein [Candidatus Acidoferrum sp.]
HRPVGNTIGQEQDQTSPSGIRSTQAAGSPSSPQLLSFLIGELDWLRVEYMPQLFHTTLQK